VNIGFSEGQSRVIMYLEGIPSAGGRTSEPDMDDDRRREFFLFTTGARVAAERVQEGRR
jgi:hypothetical protein